MSRIGSLAGLVMFLSSCAAHHASAPVTVQRPGCAAPLEVISTVAGRVAGGDAAAEDVLEETVVFSRDGGNSAYVAREGKSWFVVHQGVRSRAWDGIGFLRYEEIGPVYAGQEGERWCLRRGAAEDACFSSIYEDSVTVVGKSVAYVALSEEAGVARDNAAALVVDGSVVVRGARFALVRGSEDGKTIGVVERASEAEPLDRLYVGVAVVATAPRIVDWTPAGGITWVSVRETGSFVETRRGALGPYQSVSPLLVRGEHVAFVGSSARGVELVLDGVATGPFERIESASLVLSPSGEDFAVPVKLASGEIKVATRHHLLSPVDQGSVGSVSELVFSADGAVLGVIAADEGGLFTLSLTRVATGVQSWSQGGFVEASDLAVGPDGTRLVALTAARGHAGARVGPLRRHVMSVLEHCPTCNTPPVLTPVRAMPGTLVTDPKLSAWAVLAAQGPLQDPAARRMTIAHSWTNRPFPFDANIFGAAVRRFDQQGLADPVVAAWRSQVQSELTKHVGCPAQDP